MTTNFRTLLKEAVKVSQRADQLSKLHKMTAKGFLKFAMRNADTTHDQLDELEGFLKRPLFEASRAFYRISIRLLREPHFTSPPNKAEKLRWLGRFDEAQAELATVGSNILELFALAVRDATKKYPECFGDIDDMDTHKKEEVEARLKREELFKKIETGYTPVDLRIGSVGKGGQATVTFEVSGGEVPLGDNAGERLVNWLKNHPEAVKAL